MIVEFVVLASLSYPILDSSVGPALWVGTSLGSVLVHVLNLPSSEDRLTVPVMVSPSGE